MISITMSLCGESSISVEYDVSTWPPPAHMSGIRSEHVDDEANG